MIKTSRILNDTTARKEALDCTRSFIVQAGAGAGKTTLLVERVLSLLMHVNQPEEILCITFTNKAANEMRQRIIGALKAENNQDEKHILTFETLQLAKKVNQKCQDLGWSILDNPNRLRIQTIDSFCASLSRQIPSITTWQEREITNEPDLIYEETVYEVLHMIEKNEPWISYLQPIMKHFNYQLDQIRHLIINLIKNRDQWLPYLYLGNSNEKTIEQLLTYYKEYECEQMHCLRSLIENPHLEEFIEIVTSITIHSPTYQTNREAITHDDISFWIRLSHLLLDQKGRWRKRLTRREGFNSKTVSEKRTMLDLINHYNGNEKLRYSLYQIKSWPLEAYTEQDKTLLIALINLLKMVIAQLKINFERFNQMDFIENTLLALSALDHTETPTDLALALDYQIKHILVDEFQDTSHAQFRLIELLLRGFEEGDGRTLFVVGDPMQSIYRFRNANVKLFTKAFTEGIGDIKLNPLHLSTNFRSSHTLISWVNRTFKEIADQSKPSDSERIHYQPLNAYYQNFASHILIKSFSDLSGKREAEDIVSIIKHHQALNTNESIAILVRSREHLKEIIKALKKNQITYAANEIDSLHRKQYIVDLFTLTQVLTRIDNRLSILSLLRSPLVGLNLNDLYIIARESHTKHVSIIKALEDNQLLSLISDDAKNRISRLLPILQQMLYQRDRMPFRTWIERTWQALGGPATLNDVRALKDVNTFFDLFNNEDKMNPLILQNLKDKVARLYSRENSEGSVHLLTIHSAKGLEFDVVILPHLDRTTRKNHRPMMQWIEKDLSHQKRALLLAPFSSNTDNSLYQHIHESHMIQDQYEQERLFYVATTRAKKYLYCTFNSERMDDGAYTPKPGSFLSLLLRTIKAPRHEILHDNIVMKSIPHSQDTILRKRLRSNWQHPIFFKQMSQSQYHAKPFPHQTFYDIKKNIGRALHLMLHHLSIQGSKWWNEKTPVTKHEYLLRLLRRFSIPAMNIEVAVQAIDEHVEKLLHEETCQWILSKHQDACSEYRITHNTGSGIQDYIIDRTFIDNEGTRWIIDYKTSEPNGMTLDHFFEQEIKKYHEQMVQYHAVLYEPNRRIRLGLYFVFIPIFKEISHSLF